MKLIKKNKTLHRKLRNPNISTPEDIEGFDYVLEYTPEYLDKLKQKDFVESIIDKRNELILKKEKEDSLQIIPYIPKKRIRLTNAGKDTGAVLSTNMLDSIAKYANKVGLPIQSALGLVGQESTFGNGYDRKAKDILPSELISNWSYLADNPYSALLNSAEKKVDKIGYNNQDLSFDYNPEYIKILKQSLPYADKLSKKDKPMSVLEHGFKRYMDGSYNQGDKNHTKMVEERGNAIMQSPEIQNWLKKLK